MTVSPTPAFASVVLDADSTISSIEGIDWLAALRGPVVGDSIATLTERAMNGEVPLHAVYGERLAIIRPTATEVAALADAYAKTLAPGAEGMIARVRAAGVSVRLVSSGIRQALQPVAALLGLGDCDLFAVPLRFGPAGEYVAYDEQSPLTSANGK